MNIKFTNAASTFRLTIQMAVHLPFEHNSVTLKMKQQVLPTGQHNIIILQDVVTQETKLSSLS